MDNNKTTSKTRNQLLNLMLLKAFRERWSDSKWGINIKTVKLKCLRVNANAIACCLVVTFFFLFSNTSAYRNDNQVFRLFLGAA